MPQTASGDYYGRRSFNDSQERMPRFGVWGWTGPNYTMNPIATVTHRNLATIDLVIIGVYFLLVFCIGFYFARKERTSEDYFLAGRDIGWVFIGASLFVSNISTEHFIRLSGTGASSRLAVGHFELLSCLILLILVLAFLPFYLRSNVLTIPVFLELRL